MPALLYYIFFASVGSYGLLTWANQHATGTLVMSYTVLQPVSTALLTTALLTVGLVASCQTLLLSQEEPQDKACLDFPSFGTFCGMLGVFGGLALIISTEPKKEEEEVVEEFETVPLANEDSDLEG